MTASPARAETVGSLLRSGRLRRAREEYSAGRMDPVTFKRIEDSEVDGVVALQERVGLEVLTDGELRRAHFTGAISETVSGLEDVPAAAHEWHGDGDGDGDETRYAHKRAVTGRLARVRSLAQEEFVYLRARTDRRVKITLPSPLMMQTFWSPEHSTAAYGDPFEMFADAARLVREEIEALAALGCDYVQIDAPELGTMVDDSVRESYRGRGIDPDRILGEGLEILDTVTGVPGVTYGLHLCRGNRDGRWQASGGYEHISEAVFARTEGFHRFFLEYDDERSGGFEPLEELPRDRTVVLGLVSTKHPELEDPDALLARIEEAAGFYPREQLAVSPQCGFESALGDYPLDQAGQEDKLRLVTRSAERAWGAVESLGG